MSICEKKNLAEYKGTPIYQIGSNVYLFQWDYCSIDIEEVNELYRSIREHLPSDAALVGIPNGCSLREADIEDLRAIKRRLDNIIKEMEGENR